MDPHPLSSSGIFGSHEEDTELCWIPGEDVNMDELRDYHVTSSPRTPEHLISSGLYPSENFLDSITEGVSSKPLYSSRRSVPCRKKRKSVWPKSVLDEVEEDNKSLPSKDSKYTLGEVEDMKVSGKRKTRSSQKKVKASVSSVSPPSNMAAKEKAKTIVEDPTAAEEDNSLNLFNILYDNSDDDDNTMVDDFSIYYHMFNPDIEIDDIIGQHYDYLKTFYSDFLSLVSDETINKDGIHYIHLTSVGNKNSRSRRAIARRVNLLPTYVTMITEECPFHKGQCRVVEKLVAFLCYLSSLGNTEEEKINQDSDFNFKRTPTEKREEAEEIQLELEKAMAKLEDKKVIRYRSIQCLQLLKEETLNDSDIPVPALPTFRILEKDYILLHDIQVLFNLREDYCLALIVQQMEEEEGWVLQDPKLENLNTCFNPEEALRACFDEAMQYKAHVPTEEDFLDTQLLIGDPRKQQLLIEDQVKTKSVLGSELINEECIREELPASSINLWNTKVVEEDENNQLYVEIDKFLGRRGGLRKHRGSINRDSSLMNYVKRLPKSGMHVIHSKYSNNSYIKILLFKTISQFLGGYQINNSVSKIFLLEKHMALDIFGFASGHPSCRAGYFLTYTAYALALGIEDSKLLTGYGKSYMLCHRSREPKDDEKLLDYVVGSV